MAGGWRRRYGEVMSRLVVLCLCAAMLASGELPVPGWPVPLAKVELPPATWTRAAGELRALLPDGTVRWRRVLPPGAQLWPGVGGVLLADDQGVRWLDDAGTERRLPPLPSDVVPLGVDGAVAFFAQDRVGWRLNGVPAQVALPGEPLGSPLAAGHTSLWLTQYRLVWWDGRTVVAHRHGLAAGRGWRLARDRSAAPVVMAPDGRGWSIPAHVLGMDDERLGLPVVVPAKAERAVRVRLALAKDDWAAARRDAIGTAELAALALYAGSDPLPGSADLAPLPRDPAELALPEAAWSGGVAPRARPFVRIAMPPSGRVRDRPLSDDSVPYRIAEQQALRTRDGLVVDQRSWTLDSDGERTVASCRDDGRMRWFTRWLAESPLATPGRSLVLYDGRLLIADGDARLLMLDAGTGAIELDVRPRRLPLLPGRTWPVPGGVVVLHPPGRDDRLGRLGVDGSESDEFLPGPARWILVLPDGEIWLGLADGRTLAADRPGAWRPITLPADLVAGSEQRVVDIGVVNGEQCWTWRSRP